MAIWADTISDILTAINASSVYNTARTTTPVNLGLIVYNQAQDWLCMYKPWRDLRVETALVPDSGRAITCPADFGCVIMVYTDPSGIGKPMYFYTLNHNDIARRYKEQVTVDDVTGTRTIKFIFPSAGFLPSNPTLVYSKILAKATQAEVDAGTKKSFFPINIMLAVSKMILQDYYGVPANQDPGWIVKRVQEELRMLEGYAYNTNSPLDLSIKDQFGNPVFIQGMSLDGSAPRLNRPSPFLPSTYFTGGTG
jgi:hypothetical protein